MVDFALLGFLNSNVAAVYLQLLNPTINMGNTYVLSLPLLKEIEEAQVSTNVVECIAISKDDWETSETNWDFKKHPMI